MLEMILIFRSVTVKTKLMKEKAHNNSVASFNSSRVCVVPY